MTASSLPDPIRQAVFYDGVTAKRFAAWIIDVAILMGAFILLGALTFSLAWWLIPILWLPADFLYRWSTISTASSTFGMRAMNIELRSGDGQRLDTGEAALHTGGYLLCASFFLPLLISVLMMFGTERGQGLHDAVLGTAMINRPG